MPNAANGTAPAGTHGTFDWKAAIWASIIAGAVFMMMEMGLVAITGMGGFWAPPRMIAAIAMGPEVLPPPETFDAGILMTAMVIHMMLAIVYGFVLGWVIARWRMSVGAAILSGGLFGLLIYLVNFYGIAPVMFPWFVMAQNWVSLVSHVAFGAVLGWAYRQISPASSPHGAR
jgi:hypothetical protein